MTRKWRTLVVDDAPPARALLTSLVAERDDLLLVGESADGDEALDAVHRLRPDLVFLDIQMPGRSGFDVIRDVGVEAMPLVIFVTAYDEHAVRAFRAHAFDFLLKPLDRAEFGDAVGRAVRRLDADAAALRAAAEQSPTDLAERLDRLLATLEPPRAAEERLTIWTDGRAVLLPTTEIDRVDVDGNYLLLHAGAARHVMRLTLSALEERLPADQFVRLNRSTLVNVSFIREIQTYFRGDFAVVLRDGSTAITGETYRERLRARFRP
jgi:two-component system LytT family response regulator